MKKLRLHNLRRGIIYSFFTTILILNSCNFNSELIDSNDITIESAQQWFENSYSKNARINNDEDVRKEYFWNLASKQKVNKTDEAIIIPIIHQRKGENWSLKHLWIYNNKKKEKEARIFEYIYDTKLPKDRLQGLKNFTGAMIIRDGEGEFLGGLKITNNKIEGVITELKSGKRTEKLNTNQIKGGRVGGFFSCGNFERCNYWSISAGVGANSVTWFGYSCIADWLCYWISTNGIDPAFTGNIINIPTIAASTPINAALGGGGWPEGPPTSTSFGYAENTCRGYNIMLSAQAAQSKEIGGAITTEDRLIMFPTQANDQHNVNFTFPYTTPDGNITISLVNGNPDEADPRNDGKFQPDDVGIEIADRAKGGAIYYKITAIVHSHPIENGYDHNNPSPADKNNASQFPSKIKHYIVNNDNLIEYNANGVVTTVNRPCK
jgi:hypothetical protein